MLNRRRFIQQTAAAAAAVVTGLSAPIGAALSSEFDRFGGWKGRAFKPSGFFRVERDDRWWFVTPDGHAFLSFGVNHLHPHWWYAPYNRDAWSDKLGVSYRDTAAFQRTLAEYLLQEIEDLGFNTVGVHASHNELHQPSSSVPYIQQIQFVDIEGWRDLQQGSDFPDVFSKDFWAHCDNVARQTAGPRRDDPFVLGYAMTDIPVLTEQDAHQSNGMRSVHQGAGWLPAWPRVLRNLGAGSPGKRAYVETMYRLCGGNIHNFNYTYGTGFHSFEELLKARGWRPNADSSNDNETRDNITFLRKIVDRYYRVARDAILRHDPNHLFFGDKLNGDTDSVDTVIDITTRYTDVLFYQIYGPYEAQKKSLDRWGAVAGKPMLNGDSNFVVRFDMLPNPLGSLVENHRQRAALTREFFEKAYARPDFIGWSWCGLIDTWKTLPSKRYAQHEGLTDAMGNDHPLMRETLQELSGNLYNIAVKA